jgi:anion transporter
MKFGKQVRFVCVKGWSDSYIPYKELKRLVKHYVHSLAESRNASTPEEDLLEIRKSVMHEFLAIVRGHLTRIASFYLEHYLEKDCEIQSIHFELEDACVNEDPSEQSEKAFHKRIYSAMLGLYELRTFLEVNRTGGRKIVKKFSKLFQAPEAKVEYEVVEKECFGHLPDIVHLMRSLEDSLVTVKRRISPDPSSKSRPEIITELHASIENALLWKQSTVLAKFESATFRHNELLLNPVRLKPWPLIVAVVFLVLCLSWQWTRSLEYRAQRCLGIVGFAGILWASGAIPLWLTSFSVPFLGVLCKVTSYPTISVGKMMQQAMMSPTVLLTIGGFTIAAALRETEMDKRLATIVLQKASANVRVFLLSLIVLNAFIAMWISNVTSTMIVVTLVAQTLKQIPAGSDYGRAVILAIAVGGNLGGMMTPLSSPQNAVTIESVETVARDFGLPLTLSFTEFFATALPFSLICCLFAWGLLQLKFKMDLASVPSVPPSKTDFGWQQILVSVVSIATISIWISLPFGGDAVFSDFGIVAFIPVLIFYASGVLPPRRLADLPWNIIFMLMGGNGLGKAVAESGLMGVIARLLEQFLGEMALWTSVLVVCACVLVIDIFLTHTVSSMITLPLVCAFAATSGHLRLYAMAACMTTTALQVLPVSSFPNMCASALQDPYGKPYVTSSEVIKWGVSMTFVCFASVMSIYYGIGLAYGL